MEAELRHHLISLAEAYAAERKLEMVTVARLATGDWRFFVRVTEGASFTAKKYDAIVEWFSDNWPVTLAWPDGITRPEAASDRPASAEGAAA